MSELIVIAAHGRDFVRQCVDSLGATPHIVVDTDGVRLNGHPTAAYRWAYEHHHADRYLFIQDSMVATHPDPCGWFRDQLPDGGGAVAWGRFAMAWDTPDQRRWVTEQYPGCVAEYGIMGPVFYTPRSSLDLLSREGLLPAVPNGRIQAQGTERAWAYAFAAAGLPVVGPMWELGAMQRGHGPFRKVWAGRPDRPR